mmetsp:Transcript_30252/g.78226  ORF Transcript_30252/g.78226 Transcript_30252/m.78226 type:complete len:218 (-) Transcript_30252:413-1066(-)
MFLSASMLAFSSSTFFALSSNSAIFDLAEASSFSASSALAWLFWALFSARSYFCWSCSISVRNESSAASLSASIALYFSFDFLTRSSISFSCASFISLLPSADIASSFCVSSENSFSLSANMPFTLSTSSALSLTLFSHSRLISASLCFALFLNSSNSFKAAFFSSSCCFCSFFIATLSFASAWRSASCSLNLLTFLEASWRISSISFSYAFDISFR